MTLTSAQPRDIRAVARSAVRRHISDVAIALFAERGFDAVTVEQVAEAAGVSARSVHRHFPAKEDLVIGIFETYGGIVRDSLMSRTPDERPLTSLHAAYAALLAEGPDTASDREALRLLSKTPSLRARNVEKHLAWSALLAPIVADRLSGRDADVRARAVVEASLSAFQGALIAWADDPDGRSMVELLAVVFAVFDE